MLRKLDLWKSSLFLPLRTHVVSTSNDSATETLNNMLTVPKGDTSLLLPVPVHGRQTRGIKQEPKRFNPPAGQGTVLGIMLMLLMSAALQLDDSLLSDWNKVEVYLHNIIINFFPVGS